jgi:hypothetical protein
VKFPKDLLTLAGNASISSLSAYLTVPMHHLARDCANCTPAIVGNQSGGLSRPLRLKPDGFMPFPTAAWELHSKQPFHWDTANKKY